LLIVSGWVIPSGRFAVLRTYRQVARRPVPDGGATTVVVSVSAGEVVLVIGASGER
jgi:hypothetical protein